MSVVVVVAFSMLASIEEKKKENKTGRGNYIFS